MEKRKSKFLFVIIFSLMMASVAFTYYNTIVLHNFIIINDVDDEESE